jgi:hypothetical protein
MWKPVVCKARQDSLILGKCLLKGHRIKWRKRFTDACLACPEGLNNMPVKQFLLLLSVRWFCQNAAPCPESQ